MNITKKKIAKTWEAHPPENECVCLCMVTWLAEEVAERNDMHTCMQIAYYKSSNLQEQSFNL